MVDHQFADPRLASLYDTVCAGCPDFPFYLPLVLSAPSVLDVGCGTGALLHLAREAGHTGRLCGLDPAAGMLAQARRRSDIEWIHGDLTSAHWSHEFQLVIMTGHAFQVFLTDDELHSALAAIRSALTHDGRFIFETRNPLVREWETGPQTTPSKSPTARPLPHQRRPDNPRPVGQLGPQPAHRHQPRDHHHRSALNQLTAADQDQP